MNTLKVKKMLEMAGEAMHFKNILQNLENITFDTCAEDKYEGDAYYTIMINGYSDYFDQMQEVYFNKENVAMGLGILHKSGFKTSMQRFLLWQYIERNERNGNICTEKSNTHRIKKCKNCKKYFCDECGNVYKKTKIPENVEMLDEKGICNKCWNKIKK